MSISLKLQRVKDIKNQVDEFNQFANLSLSTIGSSIKIAQLIHQNLFSTYQTLHERSDSLKNEFNGYFDYTDHIGEEFLLLTECDRNLEKTMTLVNDFVVQYFPHASINYGERCIGARENWIDEEQNSYQCVNQDFASRRKIRGDGNCFFTSLVTTYLEYIYQNKSVETAINRLMNDYFEIPGREAMIETLFAISTISSPNELEKILSDNQKILPFVSYFRKKTVSYLNTYASQFRSSIIEMSFENYCKNVDKMGKDVDDVAVAAACLALDFPILMINVSGKKATSIRQFCEAKLPLATFCRAGEHYFVLYREPVKKTDQPKAEPKPSVEDQFIALIQAVNEKNRQKILDLFFKELPIEIQEKIKNGIWRANGEPRDKGIDFAGDLIRANPLAPQVIESLSTFVYLHLIHHFEQALKTRSFREASTLFYQLPNELRETMKKGFWLFEGMPQGDPDFGNTFFNASPQNPTVFKTLQTLQHLQGRLVSPACKKELEGLYASMISSEENKEIVEKFELLSNEAKELIKKSLWKANGSPTNQGHDFGGDFFRKNPKGVLSKEIVAQLLKSI